MLTYSLFSKQIKIKFYTKKNIRQKNLRRKFFLTKLLLVEHTALNDIISLNKLKKYILSFKISFI